MFTDSDSDSESESEPEAAAPEPPRTGRPGPGGPGRAAGEAAVLLPRLWYSVEPISGPRRPARWFKFVPHPATRTLTGTVTSSLH
jgi:hypothetical protein